MDEFRSSLVSMPPDTRQNPNKCSVAKRRLAQEQYQILKKMIDLGAKSRRLMSEIRYLIDENEQLLLSVARGWELQGIGEKIARLYPIMVRGDQIKKKMADVDLLTNKFNKMKIEIKIELGHEST